MQKTPPFVVYNASAGSGKTYTLVKEYLKVLFQSKSPEPFKRILAITFTNKAVTEMKERIINTLIQFSNQRILESPDSMFDSICEDLKIEPRLLYQKSRKILHAILHNYSAFDISTIDGFTHKLIRTFAFDLKLPLNFEVALDQEALLSEAVDSLIAKAGTDEKLTRVLVDFSIEKADEDKSWDLTLDFNKIAKLLVNENDMPFIKTLQDKTLDDFKTLRIQLKTEGLSLESHIAEQAQNMLNLIDASGLQHNDFSGNYLPKHFKKLSDKNLDVNFNAKWQVDIDTKTLYPKRVTPDIASRIEQIQPQIASVFNETKQEVFHLKFLKAFYKNITPLSVLNAINKELQTLKEAQNKMLISEFNTIISNQIQAQPAPFIYERLGEKFSHYFVDEFQDTSVMQWENLIPLLENALSAEGGSTMLVGDAKQAIYRWRGGKAEQFIGLCNDRNPFHAIKEVENLPSNFRSAKEVVDFNNGFFEFLSHQVFSNEDYKALYKKAYQKGTKEETGYVALTFLDIDKDDDREVLFSEQVFNSIKNCQGNGFKLADLCVLVRKKKEGVAVANYLSQRGIPIISSETLLINNAPEVVFINDLMSLLVQPKNNEIKVRVLNYLSTCFDIDDKHDFLATHINLPLPQLFKSFKAFDVRINNKNLLQLPLYDLAETLVRSFDLARTPNAYIQFYLDVVLDFSQKNNSDISSFLDYFDKKKESLNITSPLGQDAVQIMTIHKSKGLEFPVVIFPYADLDIYKELDPMEWFELNGEKYAGFTHALLNYTKDFEHYGEQGQLIYNKHRSEQELDNINLLYVALTRPQAQLHIISKKDLSPKGEANTKKYSGLLISYLQHMGIWNASEQKYSFGNPRASTTKQLPESVKTKKEMHHLEKFISTDKSQHNIKVVTKSGLLWDTHRQEAIEKGNLVHDIMGQIKTVEDVDLVIESLKNASVIDSEQAENLNLTILQIVEHPELKAYFSTDYIVYNERDIISKDGMVLRPDRIVIDAQSNAVIVDYKTGTEDHSHQQQMQLYQDTLEDMAITVGAKIIVYINDTIIVKSY